MLATCREPADCARLAAEGLESFPLDLADEAGLAAAAAEALARTGGRIDALVNNGAFAIPGAVEDLPRAAFREIFETNLFGQIDLTNRLLPAMRAAGRGRVVMVSSVLGLVAAPWRGAYMASKFALEGMTDTLRLELAGSGIHVVLIEPGPIATPLPAQLDPALRAACRLARLAASRGLRERAAAAPLCARDPPRPLRAARLGGHRAAGAGAGEPAAEAALLRDHADPRRRPAPPAPAHAGRSTPWCAGAEPAQTAASRQSIATPLAASATSMSTHRIDVEVEAREDRGRLVHRGEVVGLEHGIAAGVAVAERTTNWWITTSSGCRQSRISSSTRSCAASYSAVVPWRFRLQVITYFMTGHPQSNGLASCRIRSRLSFFAADFKCGPPRGVLRHAATISDLAPAFHRERALPQRPCNGRGIG